MARLTNKEFNPDKYWQGIRDKKKDDATKKALKELGINIATTPISSPYSENWKYKTTTTDPIKKQWEETGGWGFGVEKSGQGYFVPLPLVQKQDLKKDLTEQLSIAHHKNPNAGEGVGLDGFKEPGSLDDILQDIITNETLSDEEKESTLQRILGDDYKDIINKFKEQQNIGSRLKIIA